MRKKLVFSDKERLKVKKLAGYGLRDEDIANVFDLPESTMKIYFSNELRIGRSKAFQRVGKTAFEMATSGDFPVMTIFWLKTRGHSQFREVSYIQNPESTTDDNQLNIKKLSKDERAKLKELLKKATPA